jgi:hypothetical protein
MADIKSQARKPCSKPTVKLSFSGPIFSSTKALAMPCLNYIMLDHVMERHPFEVLFLTAKPNLKI